MHLSSDFAISVPTHVTPTVNDLDGGYLQDKNSDIVNRDTMSNRFFYIGEWSEQQHDFLDFHCSFQSPLSSLHIM